MKTAWSSALLTPVAGNRGFQYPAASRGTRRYYRPYAVTGPGRTASNTRRGRLDLEPPGDETEEPDPRLARMRTEAILLVAKAPLSPRKLAQMAHLADATEARTLVRQLNQTYETQGRAIRVEQVAGGFRMLTHPSLSPWLARLGHLPATVRLSMPMMETLAVVAYRQPVSRANAGSGSRGGVR